MAPQVRRGPRRRLDAAHAHAHERPQGGHEPPQRLGPGRGRAHARGERLERGLLAEGAPLGRCGPRHQMKVHHLKVYQLKVHQLEVHQLWVNQLKVRTSWSLSSKLTVGERVLTMQEPCQRRQAKSNLSTHKIYGSLTCELPGRRPQADRPAAFADAMSCNAATSPQRCTM